jgi:hypothetical protein
VKGNTHVFPALDEVPSKLDLPDKMLAILALSDPPGLAGMLSG